MHSHMTVDAQGIDETLSHDSTRVGDSLRTTGPPLAQTLSQKRSRSMTVQTTQSSSKYGQVTGPKLCNYNYADSNAL